jgi:hypothetical protein
MQVRNVHERTLSASVREIGALLDKLGSPDDRLWPRDRWPRMRVAQPLAVGPMGSHGPIQYTVEAYVPGQRVRFRFTEPRGFKGYHEFQAEPTANDRTLLRHILQMHAVGAARLSWLLVFRPLHDALLEDLLDCAAVAAGDAPLRRRWSLYVRALRWILRRLGGVRETEKRTA